ncbi:dipeptidase [Labilibaculum euxinus]|uniref:Membrane dipeptidase n=1 Tax=Labilibaculum euxinus TaxID=2686357 RepID=A0A7M4D835_9BACT|nr:dipeptidase [Labilibaculum euxinus]MUP38814.1 membrane dipeptidase [Labilibaculum euxinus]MVB08019.1 membrane dipeptidase [Labilibaculum euxinus]
MKNICWTGLFITLITVLSSCESLDQKAAKIHNHAFTVDTHVDTPYQLLEKDFDIAVAHPYVNGGSCVDFPRMKEGGLDGIFFAAFTSQRERTPENILAARAKADELIDSVYSVCQKNQDIAEVALSVEDGYRLEKEGKRAIYIGMENGFPLGNEISEVERYFEKGVRYITLCHTSNNDICDSSTDKNGAEFKGLSAFGEQVIPKMNDLGIIIDVSHISDSSFFDVLKLSKTPVIASHSCARAVCDNPRNLSDMMLKALAKNGGVIQMCILDDYVKAPDTTTIGYKKEMELRVRYKNSGKISIEEENKIWNEWRQIQIDYPKDKPTVADAVDHIDHIVNLIGIDYVGIGTDFDGGGGLKDCADVSQMMNITKELLKRNYSEEEIAKIWGGNFMRVFKEVEEYAGNKKMTLN